MAKKSKSTSGSKNIETFVHADASRKNIPTAEFESVLEEQHKSPKTLKYPRNVDLDPQLVWRGKDTQDWSDLVVTAPPLYIQEKVHPKALIDDLLRNAAQRRQEQGLEIPDLFSDFNGIPKGVDKTEFYQHDQNWTNRMILGDSLQVMASLAEREGLRGKVQCIYLDPPYGIKFNSNFQWSTTSREVKDGNAAHITREPEQVKAFRDTWKDGIHSYLTYLRDRLTVARDLLTDSGSIFVQIGDENVHRVRAVMDEVFGEGNFVALISFTKTTSATNDFLSGVADYCIWFSKKSEACKYRQLYRWKIAGGDGGAHYTSVVFPDGQTRAATAEERAGNVSDGGLLFTADQLQSSSSGRDKGEGASSWFRVDCKGRTFTPTMQSRWKTNEIGMARLGFANRLVPQLNALRYLRKINDFTAYALSNVWTDFGGASEKRYVVETTPKIVERCLLMTTDPGDLVLDPTCGSGTTAYVAEQWGRRWITIDTSRVALALARARIMGARYPYYLLADSRDGQLKEADITRTAASFLPTYHNIRHGFVYERVPHITLKSIANNAEIDVIWETWQRQLEPLRQQLNQAVGKRWEEWEIPREPDARWPEKAKQLHAAWWEARISRQKEIDASIASRAEMELLYDKPYENKKAVRVAGPFTVESISPHRMLVVNENDDLVDGVAEPSPEYVARQSFPQMVLENLRIAGVQQAHKEDKMLFESLTGWPGTLVCGDGKYWEGEPEVGKLKRAAIFIGPEFGTVQRADLVEAAKEAAESGFDVLVSCAFSYEARTTEFTKLGRIPVLKARMNADLHMAEDLKNTGKANLFVIFGEPDITILPESDGKIRVKVNGVDVYKPQTGEVVSDGPDGIACWFVDNDYNEESFFVRQAYFLGANDPYKALKTSLKAEIDPEAWATLQSDTSRAFERPKSGRIAVKVINHLGDEVMKVFRV